MTSAAVAIQQPYYNPGFTVTTQDVPDVSLQVERSIDPDTRREKICLYSNCQPGQDLIELFIKRTKSNATTKRGYKTCLYQFAKWLDDHEVTQPLFDDVQAYADDLGKEDPETGKRLTAGTQSQYVRTMKAFFRWTSQRGIYPDVALEVYGAKVKGEGYRRDALTADEAETVRESIDRTTLKGKRLYAMYMLGVRRGLRVVEMSRANIKDLSLENNVLYINIWGKGHNEPDTKRALDNDTRDAIADYLNARGTWEKTEPLFVSTSNNNSNGQRILATTISTMLKQALIDAGFNSPRLTAHSLRHTAVTMAVKCSGGNIHRGKDFARHVDPATTERYTHMDTVNDDAELVRVIEHTYHGDEMDTRQTLADIIATASDDDLDKLAQIIKERGLDNGRL